MKSLLSPAEGELLYGLLNNIKLTESSRTWLMSLNNSYLNNEQVPVIERKKLKKFWFTKIGAPPIILKHLTL
jgi:hypothetical protein